MLPLLLSRDYMQREGELESWRVAAVVVVLTAIFVFIIQRFVIRFFDVVFEICIFYVPALVSVMLYLYLRRRL